MLLITNQRERMKPMIHARDDREFKLRQRVRFKDAPYLDFNQQGYAGKQGTIFRCEPCYKKWFYTVKVGNRLVHAYGERLEAGWLR